MKNEDKAKKVKKITDGMRRQLQARKEQKISEALKRGEPQVSMKQVLADCRMSKYYPYFRDSGVDCVEHYARKSDAEVEDMIAAVEKMANYKFPYAHRVRIFKAIRMRWFADPTRVRPYVDTDALPRLFLGKRDHRFFDQDTPYEKIESERQRMICRKLERTDDEDARRTQYEVRTRHPEFYYELRDVQRCIQEWRQFDPRRMIREDPREEQFLQRLRNLELKIAKSMAEEKLRDSRKFVYMTQLRFRRVHAQEAEQGAPAREQDAQRVQEAQRPDRDLPPRLGEQARGQVRRGHGRAHGALRHQQGEEEGGAHRGGARGEGLRRLVRGRHVEALQQVRLRPGDARVPALLPAGSEHPGPAEGWVGAQSRAPHPEEARPGRQGVRARGEPEQRAPERRDVLQRGGPPGGRAGVRRNAPGAGEAREGGARRRQRRGRQRRGERRLLRRWERVQRAM